MNPNYSPLPEARPGVAHGLPRVIRTRLFKGLWDNTVGSQVCTVIHTIYHTGRATNLLENKVFTVI